MDKIKAISLVSGGLDSSLATKIILNQNIEVTALNFTCPVMCKKSPAATIEKIFRQMGVKLETVDITDDFLEIIKQPKFGYGSNLNPCVDCKILMLKKAKEIMQESGASFIVTGEVVGQRPMSQHRHTLALIEKEAGVAGLVLRPLSAKLLPKTIPEVNGWVKREKLLDINGRGRKFQFKLAEEFKIEGYLNPAGGCLLTDPRFSERLRDLMKYAQISPEEIKLLKVGRHFRLTAADKLVVGRDERENSDLLQLARDADFIFEPITANGPVALGRGSGFNNGLVDLSGSIVARYCDRENADKVAIKLTNNTLKQSQELICAPIEEEKLITYRI